MKIYTLTLFIALLCSGNIFSQKKLWYEPTFAAYTDYFSKQFRISCKIPKGFTDLNQYFISKMIRDNGDGLAIGFVMGPTLKSKDGNCIIGYPILPKEYVPKKDLKEQRGDVTEDFLARLSIIGELKSSLGIRYFLPHPTNDTVKQSIWAARDTTEIDFDKYVTTITGKKAREMFNADFVFVYDLSLQKPYKENYTYCTALVFYKKGRNDLMFKFFFTEKGKKREHKYITMLSKNIWYDENFKPEEE